MVWGIPPHLIDEVYMAEINIPVSILYSENAGTKPQASQLDIGQLWINLADGCFGSKNSSGAIVSYGLLTEAQRTQALAEVTWGSIEGDITQQTDLQNALNGKASLSGASFTGTVTVNGNEVLTTTSVATSASKLETARTITLGSDVSATITFDGTQNVQANVTVNTSPKLTTARSVDGINFDGTANVNHYAVCSTAIDSIAKTIELTNFNLAIGALAIITFTNGNNATNPTLNISSTGDKAIINAGQALTTINAGTTLMVVYDGTNYQVVGGIGGGDFSQYYTKAEMDAKFLPIMKPTAKGVMSIYAPDEAEAQPVVTAYNEAKASSAQSSGVLNCYTKEQADALFAKIVNPVIIDTLTVEDEEVTE